MRIHYYNILAKLTFVVTLLAAAAHRAAAQNDVEYRMEIGAGVGATAYQGDFNDGLFKGMQPSGAIV